MQQLHSNWNALHESRTAEQHSSRIRAAGPPSPAGHSRFATAPWHCGRVLCCLQRVKSLALPRNSTRQREMPSPECKWGVLQAGSTKLAELLLSHLLGGTSRRSSRWERWMCGVSMGFHLLLNKQKLLQCYILHHSQVAKEWSLNPFLQITPEPQEPSPVTWETEPECPISPRALQTFVHWGVVSLSHSSASSLFPLTLHLPMQIHRNKLFLFSCLQESLISARPLLPITPVTTHHWRQEHRDCRKNYIYLHP